MTRKEQKEKRRQEILFSALGLFIHNGYAGTKIQDIAEAVNMSVGLMFHYFESKEKLYEELIKLGRTGPQGFLNDFDGEPLEFFQKAASNFIKMSKEKPFIAKMAVLMSQARYNNAAPESIKKLMADDSLITTSVKKIKQGQRNGTIREGNPLALANVFWGAIQGTIEQIALIPDTPIPDSEWILDILRNT